MPEANLGLRYNSVKFLLNYKFSKSKDHIFFYFLKSLMHIRQIDGETVETVADFIFLGSKITADGDFSHEIKRHLLLGRNVMTNLDSILIHKDIILPKNVHLVKALVFPSGHVWM